jgi:hypothetical protein
MRILWVILLLLTFVQLPAQFISKDFYLVGTSEHISISQLPAYNSIGIRGELMLGKSFGTEFGFSGSRDNFHVGLGILSPLALVLVNSDSNSEGGSLAGVVLFLACAVSFVEHTNYHIRITDTFEIVPFLSLARFRVMYDRTEPYYNTDQFLSWSVGTKLSLLSKNNMVFNLSAERTQLYHIGRPHGLQAAIQIGYLFKSKSHYE